MKVKAKEEIIGALARGYCSPDCKGLVVDANLVNAMAREIIKLIEKHYIMANDQIFTIKDDPYNGR